MKNSCVQAVVAVLVLSSTLLVTAPAFAAGAATTLDRSTTITPVLDCGTFEVVSSSDVQVVTTLFDDGRLTLHVIIRYQLSNSVSGATLEGMVARQVRFGTGLSTASSGLFLRIVIPSIGPEAIGTGVVKTVDNQLVFEAGQFDDSIDLCSELA
jgi:hypothetical protein